MMKLLTFQYLLCFNIYQTNRAFFDINYTFITQAFQIEFCWYGLAFVQSDTTPVYFTL